MPQIYVIYIIYKCYQSATVSLNPEALLDTYIYINVIRSATVSLNPEALLDTNINIRSATVGLKTEALLDTYRAYQAAWEQWPCKCIVHSSQLGPRGSGVVSVTLSSGFVFSSRWHNDFLISNFSAMIDWYT